MTSLAPRTPHRHRRPHGAVPGLVTALLIGVLIALGAIGLRAPARAPAPAGAPRITAPAVRPASDLPAATRLAMFRPTPAGPPPAPAPATVRITLRRGDTLWALSHQYHTTVAALQALNLLGHRTLIYAGLTLLVPAPTVLPAAPSPSAPARPAVAAPAPAAPVSNSSAPGAIAVAFAVRQLGAPYLYGGTGPGGYDCSGLVQAAWHAAGVNLPRTTYQQVDTGTRITRNQLQPGDLIFSNDDGHVQMYIGHDTVIEAPHTGAFVHYTPLPPGTKVDAYVRVNPAAAPSTHNGAKATTPPQASGDPRTLAAEIFGNQYGCAAHIIDHESSWDPTATNPSSGAYGLGQALPASKMATAGADWRTDPATQLRWMRGYVNARYGGACAAWTFWQTHSWY